MEELFEKSSFTVITNEYQSPNDEINLTNVPILFSLTDKYGNPMELDSKLFELSVVYSIIENKYVKHGKSNFTHIEKTIEIDKCDQLKNSLDLSFFLLIKILSYKLYFTTLIYKKTLL